MRSTFHKAIMVPCLCCISFYSGNLLVGETEASFSSQINMEPVKVSAAFVFPRTIEQLENQAEQIAGKMDKQYQAIFSSSSGASLQEMMDQQNQVTTGEKELISQYNMLQKVLNEMNAFHNQIDQQKDLQSTYDYVQKGFQHVQGVWTRVQNNIDFQKVEEIRQSLQLKIDELERNNQEQVIENEND